MTVALVTASPRYIGLAADSKPSAPPAGAVFEALDTGARSVYDGSQWHALAQGLYAGGGSVVVGTTGGVTITVPSVAHGNAITASLTLAPGQNQTAQGIDITLSASSAFDQTSGNSIRLIHTDVSFTGATNSIGTVSGPYSEVRNASTKTIGHLLAMVGRVYASAAGTTEVGSGFYGTIQVDNVAHTVTTDLSMFRATNPTIGASPTIPILAGFLTEAFTNPNGAAINLYAGAHFRVPTGGVISNAGLFIGTPLSGLTGAETAGVRVASNGILVSGSPTVKENGTANDGMVAIQGGTSGTRNAYVYYYRGASAIGFIGFTNNTSAVYAGRTKTATDLVINAGNNSNGILMDTNGQIWVTNTATFAGVVQSLQGTATTGGGALALKLGASGPNVYVGSGAPGNLGQAKGSLYLRTDGSTTNDRAYIADSTTTWTALTTAA